MQLSDLPFFKGTSLSRYINQGCNHKHTHKEVGPLIKQDLLLSIG